MAVAKGPQAAMAGLRQRGNALAQWYGGLRHGSAAAWDEVRTDFVTSYHKLADALRSARAEFPRRKRPRQIRPRSEKR